MNKNGNTNNLRPMLNFEHLLIAVTMKEISASLNAKIRRSVMKKLNNDLKILLNQLGIPATVNDTDINEIVNTLYIATEYYVLDSRQPTSLIAIGIGGTAYPQIVH